jgi:drug/metabolite transporter (DMT)-like permease
MRVPSFSAALAGVAFMIGATLSWSLGSVLSTTKLPLAAGPCGFASEMLCGGAVLMAVSLALGEQHGWPPENSAAAALLYLGVFGSLIAFSSCLFLLTHASAAMATSYAFVNPLIALFPGVVFANEVVSNAECVVVRSVPCRRCFHRHHGQKALSVLRCTRNAARSQRRKCARHQ